MYSIKDVYKIGIGPSSSHTIGPQKFAEYVKKEYPNCEYEVTLYGSLALTGVGHGTDRVIKQVLGDNINIIFDKKTTNLPHPNTIDITVCQFGKKVITIRAESIGGGNIKIDGAFLDSNAEVYKFNTFNDISKYVKSKNITLADFVYENESDIKSYLDEILDVMFNSVKRGINTEGVLFGGLNVLRKAHTIYVGGDDSESVNEREYRLLSAYAFAVAEENASNGLIVTAPTCGSAGILPSVLYYFYNDLKFEREKIIDALSVAGLIGLLVKTNASVSGAECGCQAEVGVACSMTAAAVAYLKGLDVDYIECAAEIALEHNLGLTCDPVFGLVQIPCIERNAVASVKAVNSVILAKSVAPMRKLSFDEIVKVMYETGKDLQSGYRETAEKGIAKYFKLDNGDK